MDVMGAAGGGVRRAGWKAREEEAFGSPLSAFGWSCLSCL